MVYATAQLVGGETRARARHFYWLYQQAERVYSVYSTARQIDYSIIIIEVKASETFHLLRKLDAKSVTTLL